MEHATNRAAGVVGQKLSAIDKRAVTEQVARGAVDGVMAELAEPEQRRLIEEAVAAATAAAVRGMAAELHAIEIVDVQRIADRAASGALGAFDRGLDIGAPLRGQLASLSREVGASAFQGARDQLGVLFPECKTDREACVEQKIVEISRAAARGATAGFAEAARLPMLALAFLAGVTVALLATLLSRPATSRAHGPAAAPRSGG